MRIRTAHDLASVARGRRLDRGWSQAEVARRARVSRKWVSDFENGKTSVDLAAVLRLLDALGIELESVESAADSGLDELLDDYLSR